MEYYVTQEVLTSQLTGNSENITIALSMSGGIVQVEGDDSIEYNVPERLEKYPTEVRYMMIHILNISQLTIS
jgi:hypothetical protein